MRRIPQPANPADEALNPMSTGIDEQHRVLTPVDVDIGLRS
jgi:hypothetical protein